MSKENQQVRIKLTEAQKAEVRKATGKNAEAIDLTVEELEERVAPAQLWPTSGPGN